jgi:outer membrane protein assembly factor BamD (BamD/ComL family)
MRLLICGSVLLGLIAFTSCSSYEEKKKTETAIEQAVDKFHEQLNQELYHDIYSEADSTLKSRVSEADFTSQMRSAHEQLGPANGKALVIIDDSIWRGLRKSFGGKRETSHISVFRAVM